MMKTQRWTIGSGGFLGEVSLKALSDQDAYVLRENYSCCELTDLFVHPLRRNKGWAQALLNKALEHARKRKMDVFLRVVPYGIKPADIDRLTQFYQRHGFKQLVPDDERELILRWSDPDIEQST